MTHNSTSKSATATRWGIVSLIAICLCIPLCAEASYFVNEDYYYEEDYSTMYFGYEANVQAAFAEQNPSSSGSGMGGRRNVDWTGDGYEDDENLHPDDPLPLGDGTLFLLLAAAIAASAIFIRQRKQQLQAQSTTNNNTQHMTTRKSTYTSFLQKLFMLLAFVCVATNTFAWKPVIIGHRGSRTGVENTEEAFINGITKHGFQGLETDVKITSDGHYVCWHDDVITTSFGISANCTIPSSTLAKVQSLTLTQTRKSVKYTGKICTLDRFLEICKQYNVTPIVELKSNATINSSNNTGFPGLYALIEKYGLEDKTIILTSMTGSLTYIRQNYPRLTCQRLVNYITSDYITWCLNNGCNPSGYYYYDSSHYLTQALVDEAHGKGLHVGAFTMNSETDYKKYCAYGVNYLTSDDFIRKDLPELSGTDPNVPTTGGRTIYYRPSTTNFANGYTDRSNKRADGGTADGYQGVYWTKNTRLTASVYGNLKGSIFLDYTNTKTNDDLKATPSSRFMPIAVPKTHNEVIIHRIGACTEANYNVWKHSNGATGISTVSVHNTVPRWTNTTTHIPTPMVLPTDGKNLLCNREGWWDVWYWAYFLPTTNTVTMYFANINDWANVKLVTGKDIYTHETAPTKTIEGTKLAFFDLKGKEFGYEKYGFSGNGTKWDNANTIPVVGGEQSGWVYDESSSFSNNKTTTAKNSNANQNRIANRITYATDYTGLMEHLLVGANLYTPGAKKDKPTADLNTSWKNLNHTQVFKAEVEGNKSDIGGTISSTTYQLTAASTSKKITTGPTEDTHSVEAAYTATTTATATPYVGYTFGGWYEGETKVSDELTYTYFAPNATRTLTAKFIKGDNKDVRAQTYVYVAVEDTWKWQDSNDGGTFTMTHSGGTVYTHTVVGYQNDITVTLDPVTFQATPNTGYSFIGWWNNPTVYTDNPWTMDTPTAYKESVTARFATLHTAKVTLSNAGGTLNVDYNNGQASTGEQNTHVTTEVDASYRVLTHNPVTVTATPKEGYKFSGWYEGDTRLTTTVDYTYSAEADRTLTAKFTEVTPLVTGDFRLRYIEQTPYSQTQIREDYYINSDEIAKAAAGTKTIVSLHIYNRIVTVNGQTVRNINNPEIILQQFDGTDWIDLERHMVFGPLKTNNAGAIKMPSRRNADDDTPVLVVDKGIDIIKNDPLHNGSGVWNFTIVQDGTTAKLDLTQEGVKRYTGNYYIRTYNAAGGYDNYKHTGNLMTYSKYAYENYDKATTNAAKPHDFTHYFCKYIDVAKDNKNVRFTVANDYSAALAWPLQTSNDRYAWDDADGYGVDPFVKNEADEPIVEKNVHVRFSWDFISGRLTRAYIAETKPTLDNDYLIAEGNVTYTTGKYFYDNTNWLFNIDLTTAPGATATVKAKYNDQYQTLWNQAFIDGAATAGNHPVRVLYDFKEHRFTTIYVPSGDLISNVDIKTPVMILRKHNDPATRLTFNTNYEVEANGDNTEDIYTNPAYAVLTFLEDKFATGVTSTSHYEKMFYWVSFPFDVNIKDIFGLGAYGEYWALQYYDGAKRATYGLPTEESTGWEYVAEDAADAATKVLKANTGYVVCLNYRRLSKDYGYAPGGGREVSLYFPSANRITPNQIKDQADVTINLPELTSTNTSWNHHNWHLVGIPSFATPGVTHNQGNVRFVYEYWHPTDGYAPKAATEVAWCPMHSYIMQYAGDITWRNIMNIAPSSIAARRDADAETQPTLRLELQQAGNQADRTYVQLCEEEVSLGFDLNMDLTKMLNKGANIYSVVNGDQMAGNCILKTDTHLPLGVVIAEAGEYTFAMPQGTEGMVVELIDNEMGTTTNLLLSDYSVNLPKGTFNNRFALSIRPDKVATSVDNIGDGSTDGKGVRKLLIDGVLYMQQGNLLYDAQGRIIFNR